MMYTVTSWDIQSQVKVSATASLVNEQNLSFGQEGKITKVYISIWNEVIAGDILAELDMDEYFNTIQTAELEVENAKLWLSKLVNNDTSLAEAQIQSQLNEARSSHDIETQEFQVLKQQLDTTMQQNIDQLEQQKRDYSLAQESVNIAWSGLSVDIDSETEQTQNSLQSREQTINSLISTLRSNLGDAEFVVESVDRIFWINEIFEDQADTYQQSLSARNTWLKRETESHIRKSYIFLKDMKNEVDNLAASDNDDEIYDLIDEFYEKSELLITLCDSALDALDMTVVGYRITETTLQWFVVTVSSARSNANTLRAQLQSLASSINSLLSDEVQQGQLQVSIDQKKLEYDRQWISLQKQKEDIELLTTQIQTLEKDHSNQISKSQAQIIILSERKEVLEKELDDILDGADEYDIQQQQNLVRQSQLRLERSKDQQDDFQIIAEFDGRVRTVDIVEWEQYELDDRKFIVVENPNLIELKLQVSQIDIVKIKEEDPVQITFDAYPNEPISAKITSRNVNPEPNGRWWVYYEAMIVLEKQDQEILAWMSALVTIITQESKDTLIAPTLSLVQQAGKQFVQLKTWDDYELTEIQVGVTNNFQVEIVSGLKKWDIIKASVLDDEALKDMWIDDASASPFGRK